MRLQYDWSSNGIFNAAHVGLRSDSNGAAPEVDLGGRNSLATNRGSADVADGSRLCENTAFEVARRISVSVSSLWKADCTGDFS